MRGGYLFSVVVALWLIIELKRMSSCMRSGHLSGVFVVAVVGDLVA